jgi:hypothetical protein
MGGYPDYTTPGANFTPPPGTPDTFTVSNTPGSADQRPIRDYDRPSTAPTATGGAIKEMVRGKWLAAGYPPAAVEGIMRRINDESGWDPFKPGDYVNGVPTSFSLYQHHADRAQRLAQYMATNGVNTRDPMAVSAAATDFAISEMNGGDSIAAKSKGDLMRVTDPDTGYGIFTRSFERPRGSPGNEDTNIHSTAFGDWNQSALPLFRQLQDDLAKRGKQLDDALLQAKDIRSAAHAATLKWMLESDKPPANPRQSYSQFAAAASVFSVLGSIFGKHPTAAVNAMGEMLQAANASDAAAYDKSYKEWKDHTDRSFKLIGLLDGEARDIINDAKLSYDQMVSRLSVMSTSYQLSQALDPQSAANVSRNLQIATERANLIKAQNAESDHRNAVNELDEQWKKDHPEAGGKVPATVHNEHDGQVKSAAAGRTTSAGALTDDAADFMAKQYLAGDRSVLSGLGFGNVGAANRAKLRERIVVEAKARGITGDQLPTILAEFDGTKAAERTLGTVGARMALGLAEAKQFAPMVMETSDKVSRTNYPNLNAALLAAEKGTGDENVVQFAIALNALVSAYSQVLTRGGPPTDASRAQAREVFDKAYSAGQMRTAVNQVMREIEAAQAAPGMAREELRNRGAGGTPTTQSTAAPDIGNASLDDLLRVIDRPDLTADQRRQIDERLKALGH